MLIKLTKLKTCDSFCVAPLDVVKIRLQLQIHSLSDPSSHHGIKGPIYKGTLRTMRAIVREEGFTVRYVMTLVLTGGDRERVPD
jgi:hypothetical protein